jgi:hypothetical protein
MSHTAAQHAIMSFLSAEVMQEDIMTAKIAWFPASKKKV